MSEIFKKLQLKTANPILIVDAPDEFQPHLAELDDSVQVHSETSADELYELALFFVKSAAAIDAGRDADDGEVDEALRPRRG